MKPTEKASANPSPTASWTLLHSRSCQVRALVRSLHDTAFTSGVPITRVSLRRNGWVVGIRFDGVSSATKTATRMMFFVDHCRDAIRTLPMQQHDENRPEDLDTEGEDHAVDDIRYACMSRPFGARVEADEDLNPLLVTQRFQARRTTIAGV